MRINRESLKNILWVATARKDLKQFPDEVQDAVGFALDTVQRGGVPASAKPLKGFGGVSVMELVERFDTDTYRAVYTVQFGNDVYVLHCFQKKAKRGIETPQKDIELVKKRLQAARADYQRRQG